MSYSFSITADSKAKARKDVQEELQRVVTSQPVHEADGEAAQNAADAFIAMLTDPSEDESVVVSVSGSLGWRDPDTFTNAQISVSASIRPRATE